jgi:hypothetical protein
VLAIAKPNEADLTETVCVQLQNLTETVFAIAKPNEAVTVLLENLTETVCVCNCKTLLRQCACN